MEGGAKLGEGGHGVAYDLCLADNESFCDMYDKLNVKKVTIYTSDDKKEVSLEEFSTFIHRRGKYFVKILKPSAKFSLKSASSEFKDEIKAHRIVSNILDPEMYTFNKDLIGAHIEGSKTLYVVFGNKCNNDYSIKNIKKFGKDVLETLVILNKTHLHNDIKIDNIIKCGTKYKLIDWGALSDIDHPSSRTSKTTSPMKVYLEYGFAFVTKTIFTKKVNPETKQRPEFQEQYKRIMTEFQENIQTYTKKDLIKKYHGTHDVFQLGITMLIVVLEQKLNYEKVKDIIEKLTSLNNPITAKEAISLF
jgi:hypothetical protein